MKKIAKRKLLPFFSALFLSGWSFAGAAEEITVSYASIGAAYMDHVAAMEKGYLAEEGLNVKIMRSGGGSATQTLLSGQIHFSSSAGSALSAALRGGPLKIVYTNQSRPTYKLLANKPEIKTLQDLIGKKIAINTFGDTGHLATLLLLKKYRMDPKQFVFIAVRSEARFPAFLSGSIDAAPLSPRDIAQIGQMRSEHHRRHQQGNSAGLERRGGVEPIARGKPCAGGTLSSCSGEGKRVRAPLQGADHRHGGQTHAFFPRSSACRL